MRWTLAVGLAVAGFVATPARADTITLEPSKDNSVYEESGALSNALGNHLFTGKTQFSGFGRRTFIAFDVASAIPAGSTITSVTLTMYVNKANNSNPLAIEATPVIVDWGEATSLATGNEGQGGAATVGDVTWDFHFYDTDAWVNPGGDVLTVPSAVANVGAANAAYSWNSADLVTDVQGWVDFPATNFGWMLDAPLANFGDAKRFSSRENGAFTERPQLVIEFTPPAQSGACCAGDGTCTVVNDPGTSCAGTYQGSGSTCSPNTCPQPTGACCIPDAQATCLLETELDCDAFGGTWQGPNAACGVDTCPVVLTPFVDPLVVPPVAQPTVGVPGGTASYEIAMKQFTQRIHSDLPPTTVWGFDDGVNGPTFPGPTIEATTNQPITMRWVNDLRDTSGNLLANHYLNVDTCMHGPVNQDPRLVVHLHGGHVSEQSDGHPEYTILPGQFLDYDYPNWQAASTLWYHDHALGITRLNVYMGLSGFYLVRDAAEAALGLPSGAYEVPLAVMDRTFRPDGSLVYPVNFEPMFFGDTTLVNGVAYPYLDVDRGKYRFRILNGAGSRTYRFAFDDGTPFVQVGSDGGLLDAPVTRSSITVAPGERVDVVVDFGSHPAGSTVVLTNDAPIMFPGTPGNGVIPNVMQFRVGTATGHTAALPATLGNVVPLPPANAAISRDFVVDKMFDPCTSRDMWMINGLMWDDIVEFPVLGTTEIWRFVNDSGMMHPMHMHLVFFQVIDTQPFTMVNGSPVPTGPAVPPDPADAGWKDTIQVAPGEMVRVIARFEDFVGDFAYHCHILEHEDHEMMRQFTTTTTCGDGARGLPVETCDDGNLDNSDDCPDGTGGTCQNAFCGDGFVWNTENGTEACDDAGESATCDVDCTLATCGDGTLNPTAGELCDDVGESLTCDSDCTDVVCGDGTLNVTAGEVCDDAGESIACDVDCTVAVCGDGTINLTAGETCDDIVESTFCDIDCTDAICGDGTLNVTAGEACDDAGTSATCDADCTPAVCGDGTTNPLAGEACDDAGESAACDLDCSVALCGDGTLNSTAGEACDDAGESSACNVDCSVATCGDGIVNATAGEECDDAGPSAACDADCTFAVCGDGTLNALAGETCDDAGESATCDADCTTVTCGDGTTNPTAGEACDDAGESATCDADCTVALCGDGLVNVTAAEACDDAGESAACDLDCTVATCGDGTPNATAGEACDDAGESAACDTDCTVATCGDGLVNVTAAEACDDAGESASCDLDCTPATCGDGTLNATANEACDDAGESATCDNDCTIATCGDGTPNATAGEACDTAGASATCDADCSLAVCGDGTLNPTAGEACDDAGVSATCDADCTVATCGDGTPNALAGEACDDAGESAACDADCTVATCGDGTVNALANELCDDAGESAICDSDCTAVACGDGTTNATAGEACDTAGESATCDNDCTLPVCGDGRLNSLAGEVCDTGGESVTCDVDCTAVSCGDGTTNAAAGEACDDAGESAACDADCTEAICGDGTVNALANELCDDAGESATCDIDCTEPACGDGTLNVAAGETCDDGGESAACNADCTEATCGDGIVNVAAGEACDDEGASATCDVDCTEAVCGDGTANGLAGEACDDGEESATCNADCTEATCGDGIVNVTAGEACDEGGPTETCDANCALVEPTAPPPVTPEPTGCSQGATSVPSSAAALGIGLLGLAGLRRRRSTRRA